MKYIVLINGTGDGCDYTIGCNLTWRFINAVSIEDAKDQILKEIVEEPDNFDLTTLEEYYEKFTFIEINGEPKRFTTEELCDDLIQKINNQCYEQEKRQEIEREKTLREQYEVLKKRFEKQ